MIFIECVAIILRRNIFPIGPGRRQNRPSGGFMTASWIASDAVCWAAHKELHAGSSTRRYGGRCFDRQRERAVHARRRKPRIAAACETLREGRGCKTKDPASAGPSLS